MNGTAPRTLRVATWNAQGISNKKLAQFLVEHQIDITPISETWLKPDKKFRIANLHVYRTRYPSKKVPRTLAVPPPCQQLTDVFNCDPESRQRCGFVACYNPPQQSINTFDLGRIADQADHVFISGDLNSKHRSWNSRADNKTATNVVFST
ncbi:hypothetical protein Trydic_g19910 [Trypoxylus dichotomus]